MIARAVEVRCLRIVLERYDDSTPQVLNNAITFQVEAGGTEEKEGSDATGGKNETEGADAPGGLSPYEALYLGLDGDLLRRSNLQP